MFSGSIIQERTVDQTVNLPAPQIMEKIEERRQVTPQQRMQNRISPIPLETGDGFLAEVIQRWHPEHISDRLVAQMVDFLGLKSWNHCRCGLAHSFS